MAEALRVLVDANHMGIEPRGVGVYARRLVEGLVRRGDLDVTLTAEAPADVGERFIKSPGMNPRRNEWPWMQWSVRRVIKETRAQVFHSTLISVPLRCSVPTVSTVHDVTARVLPRLQPAWGRARAHVMTKLATRANRIILPTASAAEDFLRYYDYPRSRIRVIHEAQRDGQGPAPAEAVSAMRARRSLERPYFLCVGAGDHQKRARDAVAALAILREAGHDVTLVLVGKGGGTRPAVQSVVRRRRLEGSVQYTGYVTEPELDSLYTGAVALLYPSLYEGFGLPPLEAMACGTPVVASPAAAHLEVLGDAALFVPFRAPGAIAATAARLLKEPGLAEEYRGRGFERAALYSWKRAAEETAAVYRELA